jgi:hypothetical protein
MREESYFGHEPEDRGRPCEQRNVWSRVIGDWTYHPEVLQLLGIGENSP